MLFSLLNICHKLMFLYEIYAVLTSQHFCHMYRFLYEICVAFLLSYFPLWNVCCIPFVIFSSMKCMLHSFCHIFLYEMYVAFLLSYFPLWNVCFIPSVLFPSMKSMLHSSRHISSIKSPLHSSRHVSSLSTSATFPVHRSCSYQTTHSFFSLLMTQLK